MASTKVLSTLVIALWLTACRSELLSDPNRAVRRNATVIESNPPLDLLSRRSFEADVILRTSGAGPAFASKLHVAATRKAGAYVVTISQVGGPVTSGITVATDERGKREVTFESGTAISSIKSPEHAKGLEAQVTKLVQSGQLLGGRDGVAGIVRLISTKDSSWRRWSNSSRAQLMTTNGSVKYFRTELQGSTNIVGLDTSLNAVVLRRTTRGDGATLEIEESYDRLSEDVAVRRAMKIVTSGVKNSISQVEVLVSNFRLLEVVK